MAGGGGPSRGPVLGTAGERDGRRDGQLKPASLPASSSYCLQANSCPDVGRRGAGALRGGWLRRVASPSPPSPRHAWSRALCALQEQA